MACNDIRTRRVDTGRHDDRAVRALHRVEVLLNDEELAAVDGWRCANLLHSNREALRELVRLGLLSEIAKLHQLVEDIRASVDGGSRSRGHDA